MKYWSLFFTMLAITCHGAVAQDVCGGILTYTGRDVINESRENSVAAELYTQHCEGSSAKKSSTTSIGLEAVVKAIPVKFNFGGTSGEERLNNFCKTYDSRRSEFSAERIDKSIVVREALSAFNECVSLAAKGIFFNPKIGRTTLVIDVRRGSDDASITGVSYDPDLMTCRLPPKAASGGRPAEPATVATTDTTRDLDGNYLPMVCERKPQVGASGEKSYPRAELIVATSRGSFFLPVVGDVQLPQQWASDIGNRLAGIEAMAGKLEARAIKCEMQKATVQGHYPSATASIPNDKRGKYKLSGGSCSINYYPETPHNGTILVSRPSDDNTGWYCIAGDPPNIPLTLNLTAYAIFCALAE
ncbi:hypothetical protein [Prosthecomicrobium hirschii]|uniref:hypothetical protein n=1 Tax=Prosthecodimorpha hirschii TaxID=665126 RepID=UPI0022207941|nr:hypothetical protein [Prosthecomicrobium hirschii]MCW1841765.1 hypothetical protein [Prosthecomicrobium hirschii]